MGDANSRQPESQAGRASGQSEALTSTASTLSEQTWHSAALTRQGEKVVHEPMRQAQAQSSPSDTVGLQGTWGAPPVAPSEAPAAPKPKVIASNPQAGGFTYNPDSPPPSPAPTGFQPAPYDIDKPIGADPMSILPDYAAKLVGTAIGVGANHYQWKDVLTQHQAKFDAWRAPEFKDSPLVAQATIKDFTSARASAQGFLKAQYQRLNPLVRKLDRDPGMWSTADHELAERLANVRVARDATTPLLENGNNPLSKVDLDNIKKDPDLRAQPSFHRVETFDRAQTALIDERAAKVQALKDVEKRFYEGNVKAAKWGRFLDYGALFGAEATNMAIDTAAPRNRISGWTTAVDFAAPLIMAARLTPFGKYAPLVKYGVIVGSHALMHFTCDQEVDENNPKQ